MAEERFTLARDVLINVIRPALQTLGRDSLAAEQLVLGTGIQESLLIHRQQLGGGPARGLFQMEPATQAITVTLNPVQCLFSPCLRWLC